MQYLPSIFIFKGVALVMKCDLDSCVLAVYLAINLLLPSALAQGT